MTGCVRWLGALSAEFDVKRGIRQGGINSSWFLNVYVNELISRLRKSGVGFYVYFVFIGCIFFADDLFLLSGSILHLQILLNICLDFGVEFDITLIALKFLFIQFGLDNIDSLLVLSLGTGCLQKVDRIKYLGIWLEEGTGGGGANFSKLTVP